MLKNLFSSQVRIDLLGLFFLNPDKEFYLRELVVRLNGFPRAVSVELKNLADIGLVKKRIAGKQHYYRINRQHPIYTELRDIFVKTTGFKDVLKSALEPFKSQIQYAFVYGSMANGSFGLNSDIDLLIVGEVSGRRVSSALASIGDRFGREINYSIYPLPELKEKIKKNDHFFSSLLQKPYLFILGNENEFTGLVEQWLAKAPSNEL
jgi:predicted nucleotidyltransferase